MRFDKLKAQRIECLKVKNLMVSYHAFLHFKLSLVFIINV